MGYIDSCLFLKSNLFCEYSNHLYNYKKDKLIKLVPNNCNYYESLKAKDIKHCNFPVDVYKVDRFLTIGKGFIGGCAISIPYLVNYDSMADSINFSNLDDISSLKLLKKQMLSIKKMHDNGVFHGDISPYNIMVDSKFDYQFIDFDMGIVDDNISVWNIYEDSDDVYHDVCTCDKLDLIFIYFKHFLGVDLGSDVDDFQYRKLRLPKDIYDTIFDYRDSFDVPRNYYFIDMIDYLIDTNYMSSCKKRVKK